MSEVITNNNEKSREALTALSQVNDPEIGLNIVDLGLVYQLDFDDENKKLYAAMTLTTQFCPMGNSIRSSAAVVLQQAFPGYEVLLEVVFEPAWTAARISDEGRQFLNR